MRDFAIYMFIITSGIYIAKNIPLSIDKSNIAKSNDGQAGPFEQKVALLFFCNPLIIKKMKKSPAQKAELGQKWVKQLEALKLLPGLKFAFSRYSSLWLHVNGKIAEIDQEIAAQAEKDGLTEMMYRSVPGVGPTSARVLANELGDMSQFNNERQLFSYMGLVPSEHSSGGHIRQGHITRQGRPLLRKIPVQVAWKAIKLDNSLKSNYEQLSKKVGGRKAIVGIARKIIGRISSTLQNF